MDAIGYGAAGIAPERPRKLGLVLDLVANAEPALTEHRDERGGRIGPPNRSCSSTTSVGQL